MLENQFIQFTSTSLSDAKKRKPLPIFIDDDNNYTVFYDEGSGYTATKIAAVDPSGNVFEDEEEGWVLEDELSQNPHWIQMFGSVGSYLENLYGAVSHGDTFFLRITRVRNGYTYYLFSQPLVRVPNTDCVDIKYWCTEDSFGFPFYTISDELHTQVYAMLPLLIRMHKPQPIQDDKTYVKADGSVVTLYAKYYKEWECETDFLSEEMHDKIIAALSCDVLYINGTRVTKTDSYKIDWENYDLDCDGVTKLAKATFKVRANVTQRNSNY